MFVSIGDVPSKIRVSLGTAMLLGLFKEGKMDVSPTSAYLMMFAEGKCRANCSFCPQARDSKGHAERLARVTWPSFPTFRVIEALNTAVIEGKVKRVCIQALNVLEVFLHIEALVGEIKRHQPTVEVSVSCQPFNREDILGLKNAGVDRVGIALDAVTEEIFYKVKGANVGSVYSWIHVRSLLEEAVLIFGAGKVSTHLIVGLGEVEKEIVDLIQWCVDKKVLPAIFAFTPVRGTVFEQWPQPCVVSYRRVQLARYLLVQGMTRVEYMHFDAEGKIVSYGLAPEVLRNIVREEGGVPFQTSGCPNCNRPFYNEKVKGPLYNYPRQLNIEEIEKIEKDLGLS